MIGTLMVTVVEGRNYLHVPEERDEAEDSGDCQVRGGTGQGLVPNTPELLTDGVDLQGSEH